MITPVPTAAEVINLKKLSGLKKKIGGFFGIFYGILTTLYPHSVQRAIISNKEAISKLNVVWYNYFTHLS